MWSRVRRRRGAPVGGGCYRSDLADSVRGLRPGLLAPRRAEVRHAQPGNLLARCRRSQRARPRGGIRLRRRRGVSAEAARHLCADLHRHCGHGQRHHHRGQRGVPALRDAHDLQGHRHHAPDHHLAVHLHGAGPPPGGAHAVRAQGSQGPHQPYPQARAQARSVVSWHGAAVPEQGARDPRRAGRRAERKQGLVAAERGHGGATEFPTVERQDV
mmetsp:Transcript_59883/g.160114  ORF Transcript_59883/g.160114 Transcript_59883/m.160114 type:complete len:214 (-) Transcript_59883:11-652(-)